ncbi:MAG: hypothetical protein K2R98_21025 [Gemmataceae bacterium]|nr:hypothetical protein [Gemmataceae bacterium]
MPEKILLASYQLEEQGQSPFSAEALIVAAWQKFPRTFGLKGYSDQYPDSNKILTSIMGEKGLARRGWLAKMGQKLYSLTREGRQAVRRLMQDDEGDNQPATAKLSREQEKFLLGLFATNAVEKYQQGLKLELTFSDACKFWGITENLRGEALDARMDKLRANLAEADRVVGSAGADLSNGRNVSADEMRLLHKVDEYLMERFSRHLSLLRNRVERN